MIKIKCDASLASYILKQIEKKGQYKIFDEIILTGEKRGRNGIGVIVSEQIRIPVFENIADYRHPYLYLFSKDVLENTSISYVKIKNHENLIIKIEES